MLALFKGNILLSIHYNSFYVYVVLFGSIFMISQTIEILTKGKIKGLKYRNIYLIIPIILLILQCIIRNIIVLIWGIHII